MASPRLRLYTTVSLMLVFGAIVMNDKVIPDESLLVFIFDKFEFDQAFIQQRRFITEFVEELPDGTLVFVVTVGQKIEHFEFKKIAGDESWKSKIGVKSLTHVNITNETVGDAIKNFLDKNGSKQITEIFIWLVNEYTTIDQKFKEEMKNQNNQIVLYGRRTDGDVWTDLSKNEESIQKLGDGEAVINSSVQAVMRRISNDFFSSEKEPLATKEDPLTDNQERDDMGPMIIFMLAIQIITLVVCFLGFFKNINEPRWKSLKNWVRRKISDDTHEVKEEADEGLLEEVVSQSSMYQEQLKEKDRIIKQLEIDLAKKAQENKHLESELSLKEEIIKCQTEIKVKDEKIEEAKSEREQSQHQLDKIVQQLIPLQNALLDDQIMETRVQDLKMMMLMMTTILTLKMMT